jgi:hypothetical protein
MKVFFSISFCLFIFLSVAQKAFVSLNVDAKNVEIGNPLTFTVKSNVEGNVEIAFPDEFIQGYGSMNGLEQEMDHNTGSVSTIYYFSQNGAFKENGSYSIYAYIKNKKAIYKSNKVVVKVEKETTYSTDEKEISRKNQSQPVFGIIQRSKTKIYEGESIVLEAKVYSKLDINMLEAYQSFEIDGGSEIKEIDKTSNLLLKKENYKGSQYLTFTYGKQVVFPSSTGKMKIKPFEMSLQYRDGGIFSDRISFTSNVAIIEVLPLPGNAPKDFIGAVGKFDFSFKIDKNKIKEKDVVVLEIEISGTGNIQNINTPNLNLPNGLIVYGDPEIRENINYGNNGAEGSIVYTYNLQSLSVGDKKIPALSISYFDPNLKKYTTIKKEGVSISVLPSISDKTNDKVVKNNDTKSAENSKTKEISASTNSAKKENTSFANSIWFWPSVISPLFLAFIGGVFYFKKQTNLSNREINKTSKNKSLDKSSQLRAISTIKSNLDLVKNLNSIGKTKEAFTQIELTLKSFAYLFVNEETTIYSMYELNAILKDNNVSATILTTINSCQLKCEEVRYTFDDSNLDCEKTIIEVEQIFNQII